MYIYYWVSYELLYTLHEIETSSVPSKVEDIWDTPNHVSFASKSSPMGFSCVISRQDDVFKWYKIEFSKMDMLCVTLSNIHITWCVSKRCVSFIIDSHSNSSSNTGANLYRVKIHKRYKLQHLADHRHTKKFSNDIR